MAEETKQKSRREKRKEARAAVNNRKHESWLEHQKARKLNRSARRPQSEIAALSGKSIAKLPQQIEVDNQHCEEDNIMKEVKMEKKSKAGFDSSNSKPVKKKKGLKKESKTKFEEYLEMSTKQSAFGAEEDLEMERKLARKLKVKGGRLRDDNDEMNDLFEGISSTIDESYEDTDVLDYRNLSMKSRKKDSSVKGKKKRKTVESASEEDGMKMGVRDEVSEPVEEISNLHVLVGEECPEKQPSKKRKKRKKSKPLPEAEDAVDTALEVSEPDATADVASEDDFSKGNQSEKMVKYVPPHLRNQGKSESEEYIQMRRRVRGLLNRISESNVESITGEISAMFHSVPRGVATQIVSEEALASCSNGPRGNEQYAAVFAAFIAGMACSTGIDFSAKFIASLAKLFEDEYLKKDNISLRNLILLLCYLCIFGVCSSDLLYDFLFVLSKRLSEIDVSTILTILQCCGMKLRSDDPSAMKSFILTVQNRVNELKNSVGGQTSTNNKRMEFMLETICDIKNNKKRAKEDTVQHTRIKKWLQKLRVEDILIRGVTWSKLLDPHRKGQWWLSGNVASTTDYIEEVASKIDKEVLEAQKMVELASAQRMNTDARKAIFCIIMSGEDYVDAFEKLLRLDLSGKQDREIMRVLVDCCLQEKVFNKYYPILASKLCNHDKNHKFTLQFCLWDHFKELDSMQPVRSIHLAQFVAEMLVSFTLSLTVLKAVDLSDSQQLTPKRIMHFRMLFETLFEQPDGLIWNTFTRVAVAPELETLRNGIEFFIKEYVVNTNKSQTKKFKVVKKALSNGEGVLM